MPLVENVFLSDISDLQKDMWVSKSLKSIGSMNNNHYNLTLSEDCSNNNSDSLDKKGKKSNKITQRDVKKIGQTSENGFEVNIDLDSSNKINSISIGNNSDGEARHISNKQNDLHQDKKDKHDKIINNSKNNWQLQVFSNIVHMESRNQPVKKEEQNLSKNKKQKRSPRRRLKSPKKSPKKSKKNHTKSKEKEIENHIESEYGQLSLPSSAGTEKQQDSESIDIDIEYEKIIKNSRSPTKSRDINISIENLTSQNSTRKGINGKRVFYSYNTTKSGRQYYDNNSDIQDDLALEFHKKANLLSASDSYEDNQTGKAISTKGIMLYMLSSSDNDETPIESVQTNLVENTNQTLSESSSTLQTKEKEEESINESEIESDFAFEKHSSSGVNSENNEFSDLIASLTIVQAHGLPLMNMQRRDPYCMVNIKGSSQNIKTKVMRDTTSPIWNNKFNFHINDLENSLVFTIKYEDKFGGDSDVAVGEISLKEVPIGEFFEKWIRLHPTVMNIVSNVNDNSSDYITSACELFITIFLKPKPKAKKKSGSSSPKKMHLHSSSPYPSPNSNSKSLHSFNEIYEGEIDMALTIVEAKGINLHSIDEFLLNNGLYCAINILGRKNVKKTKTIYNMQSPIWDTQFKFTLANQKDVISFHIRNEDKINGDFTVFKAIVPVNKFHLNSFIDKWVTLQPVKVIKRQTLKNKYKKKLKNKNYSSDEFNGDSLIDDFLSDEELESNNESNKEPNGSLHITLVLEPKDKDIPISPIPSPSPHVVLNVSRNNKNPASPMSYYMDKKSENQ